MVTDTQDKKIPAGYKQTEVGVIPSDWEVKMLRDGIKLLSGHHVLAQHCNIDGRGFPYITGPADFPEGVIQHSKFTDKPTTRCRANDILVTVKGSGAGTLVLADAEYCISRQLMAVRVTRWDTRYIYFFLRRQTSLFGSAVAGLIPGLSRGDILSKQIAVPPTIKEQTAIASVLSDADALIEGLEKLIAKKRAIKQGTMQELLTGKRRLSGFSEEWRMNRFVDLFQFLNTANNPRSDLSEFGDIDYIHYGDIHTTESVFLDCADTTLPKIAKTKVVKTPLIEDGDLVMVDASEDYAGLGKSVEIRNTNGRQIVAGLHTFLLRGNRNFIADGFKGYLQFIPSVKSALIRLATGISVYGISRHNIKQIEVLLPHVEEQTAIASVLSDMDAEIEALEQKLAKYKQLKQGMMQVLLTGKIRLLAR